MSSHDISQLRTVRMADRPRLLSFLESTAGSKPRRQRTLTAVRSSCPRAVAGHVFNSLRPLVETSCAHSQAVTSTHLAPSCCEAGAGQPFVLQRSFESFYKDPSSFRRSSN